MQNKSYTKFSSIISIYWASEILKEILNRYGGVTVEATMMVVWAEEGGDGNEDGGLAAMRCWIQFG